MTEPMQPNLAPPISSAYVQQGPMWWRNLISGDIVRWSPEQGVYQRWDPNLYVWSWWGPKRDGSLCWHRYVGYTKIHLIDFWANLAVGILVFLAGNAVGQPGGGAVVLVFFTCFGIVLSWLHTKHPTAYGLVAVAGYIGAFYSATHRHRQPW